MCLWLRLFRVAKRCGQFDQASLALDHILTERPTHPIALPLSLPFYLAISEFEVCLELSARALKLDPLDERALYCIQRIGSLQPSLLIFTNDTFDIDPGVLSEPISEETRTRMDREVDEIRTVYRKQRDADADAELCKIKRVDFPELSGPLTWENLLEATVSLFDDLDAASELNSVLNLEPLIPEGVSDDRCSQSAAEVANASASPNPADATEGDQLRNLEVSMMSSEPVEESDTNEREKECTGSMDVSDTVEKRRSARARPVVDLTDGLNRYRTKRGWCSEFDSKPLQSRNERSPQKNGDTLTRFRLAEQMSTLLPSVFRDLAQFARCKDTDEVEDAPAVSETMLLRQSLDNGLAEDSGSVGQQEPWATKTVYNFVKLLHETKPNVITFGIALLLQVSQLSPCRWSCDLASHYVALFDRLRCSFPHPFISPQAYFEQDSVPTPTEDEDEDSVLLPTCVLQLRRPPSLSVITRLHVTYVELRLEQLERVISFSDPQVRDPRASEDEQFLANQTIFTLLDAFGLYGSNSFQYHCIRAHYLWINYLLSSLVRDYQEMRIFASLLEELLVENRLKLHRNYSVYHGSLTVDYVRSLLSDLNGVTEFEQLSNLAKQDNHTQVVKDILLNLRKKKSAFTGHSNYSEMPNTSGHVKTIDQLALFRTSIRHLVSRAVLYEESPESMEQDLDLAEQWLLLYSASATLLDHASRLCIRENNSEITFGRQTDREDFRKSAYGIALDAIELISICWNEMEADSQSACSSNSAPSSLCETVADAGRLPLRMHLSETSVEPPTCDSASVAANSQRTGQLYISEACYAVSVVLDFLAWCVRSQPEFVWSTSPTRIVSFVFEHLACIEQSVPIALLPLELQPLTPGHSVESDTTQPAYRLHLLCGTATAPPSLAWLHIAHHLLHISYKGSGDRLEPLALLRQIVVRTRVLLDAQTANWGNQQAELLKLQTEEQPDMGLKEQEGANLNAEQEESMTVGNNDDETVACVDELDLLRSWPCGIVSINQVLAQALHCLLPATVLADVNSCVATYDPNASEVLFQGEQLQQQQQHQQQSFSQPAHLGQSRSCAVHLFQRIPLWTQYLSKLFVQGQLSDLSKSVSSSNNPAAWWVTDRFVSTDSSSERKILDWNCMQTVFYFCCPSILPEYDSVKTLSITSEVLQLLLETCKILPASEEACLLHPNEVELMMQTKVPGSLGLPEQPENLSPMTKLMYYLIADHYMKNNNFDGAVEYYLKDLRACPQRSDTWAALALIYHSELEQIVNLTSLRTERVSPDAVSRCLRCFTVSLLLLPNAVTLFIERGCLTYQLHSYSARMVKKSVSRTFPEAHLNLCRKWRYRMLQVARSSYTEVLALARSILSTGNSPCEAVDGVHESRPTADSPRYNKQATEEEWLCHYMLAKCSEKEANLLVANDPEARGIAQYLLGVLQAYNGALEALDAAGAKYPKKIIVYHKLPFRAVEAIEVFYRIHALALKTLLHYGPPSETEVDPGLDQIPLQKLLEFLTKLQSSEFVAGAGKPRRSRKRPANSSSLQTKGSCVGPPPKQICEASSAPSEKTPHPREASQARNAPTCSEITERNRVIIEELANLSSQDDFIDLTSAANSPDENNSPEPEHATAEQSPLTIWKECVARCRCALELVLQRLPLHYKAMYRLADLYCRAPHLKDLDKALSILLGPLDESTKPTVGGLFKDRKQNNFFHGVWRIPTADIDRSGNFAAHMYRSVSLTLDLLHEKGDWRHLVHIFHQLRKQPPEEKRGFLGEGDRVFLARRAFTLIRPTLVTWLTQLSQSLSTSLDDLLKATLAGNVPAPDAFLGPQRLGFVTTETLTQIYRLHCVSFSRNSSTGGSPRPGTESKETSPVCQKTATVEAVELSGYADVLRLAFRFCPMAWDSRGPDIPLEAILKRCAELTSSRPPAASVHSSSSSRSDSSRAPTVAPTSRVP
ncbi:Calcineurin-binding protein cabin-1, variant 2 [Clonorchis sinensis]|uniref:Calcineurin-binding protein cabin-1, variant 2 n=2 Tax=Clonorchis sinensis TaxID=79923 RepID=A0A8T1MCQ6_CLOSI|nr:Calcineurin-binding protein cabin-1, variant 2 [Clonorchis sinensis]